MRCLEERLGNSIRAGTDLPRNTALDILTGRIPDYRFNPAAVIDSSAPASAATEPTVGLLRPSSLDAHMRFRLQRISPPPPPPSPAWPRLVRRAGVAVLLVGGVMAVRGWQSQPTPVGPATAEGPV